MLIVSFLCFSYSHKSLYFLLDVETMGLKKG